MKYWQRLLFCIFTASGFNNTGVPHYIEIQQLEIYHHQKVGSQFNICFLNLHMNLNVPGDTLFPRAHTKWVLQLSVPCHGNSRMWPAATHISHSLILDVPLNLGCGSGGWEAVCMMQTFETKARWKEQGFLHPMPELSYGFRQVADVLSEWSNCSPLVLYNHLEAGIDKRVFLKKSYSYPLHIIIKINEKAQFIMYKLAFQACFSQW